MPRCQKKKNTLGAGSKRSIHPRPSPLGGDAGGVTSRRKPPGLLFPSWSRLENPRHCWKRPRAPSHHVARAKPGVPRAKPLPKWERENFGEVSTFPAASRPPAGAVPGGSPDSLGAAAGRVVPAIPGCRRKQERRRRVLSHGQAGGADRRPRAGAPPGGSPRLGRGQAHARQRRRPRVALLRSQGWPGADNISPRLETSEDVLGSPAGGQR